MVPVGSYPVQSRDDSNRRILFASEDKWPPCSRKSSRPNPRTRMLQNCHRLPYWFRPFHGLKSWPKNVSALFRRPRDFVAADVEKLLQFEAVLRTRELFGRNTHDQDFRGILEECLLAAFLGCFYHQVTVAPSICS